jgi:predicted butyrate kinase (DUF1464 family)
MVIFAVVSNVIFRIDLAKTPHSQKKREAAKGGAHYATQCAGGEIKRKG